MIEFKDWRRAFAGDRELAKLMTPKGQVWPTYIPVDTVLWQGSQAITTAFSYLTLAADPQETINGIRYWIKVGSIHPAIDVPKGEIRQSIAFTDEYGRSVRWRCVSLQANELVLTGAVSGYAGYGTLTKITAY